MRPAAVSVGPVLAEVRDGLEMSTTVAGVLTSLPVVLFALVGAVAPWLSRTVGIHRTILASLLAVTAGLALRSMVRSEEHTSELQSLMRSSYAVFCLKKNTNHSKKES